ncbi:hypothetical protein GYB22_11140 [bacterium]|nr:hypothetical protein [bacterium]
MIKTLSNNYFSALLFSLVILSIHVLGAIPESTKEWALLGMLFSQMIILDILCQKYRILGIKSHLPLIVCSLLSIIIIPYLGTALILMGYLWLLAIYLSFGSREGNISSVHAMIYIGTMLGVAQTINHWSVFLFLPFFIMFWQNTVQSPQHFIISLIYFAMVLAIYTGVTFVMEIIDKAWSLIPEPTFDYSLLNTPLIKVFLPFVVLMLVLHILSMGNYKFRYPNRSIIINYMLLSQLVIGAVLILITADPGFFALIILPMAALLSVGFAFNQGRLIVEVGFAVFMLISIGMSMLQFQGYLSF